ncbi:response regulator [Azonexus fungiphilus]|uniref:response regulator n=1 Tax=Azonexus fungiphilus TaxID=146940 RepID=UPI00156AB7DD|nr:response regulator [Azonexus fungiphilus]NHC06890.1 response regulator [Azonexus fungiphilus]
MTAQYVLNYDSSLRPILVVEDNDMDIDFCVQAFDEHSIANPVIACRDGDEAIAFINTHGDPLDPQFPLLVLLDLRLPKVDGIEVLRHARKQANWQLVPIVVMTTSNDNGDVKVAYQEGANSYILKPVDFARFSEVVKYLKVYWILSNEAPFGPTGRG